MPVLLANMRPPRMQPTRSGYGSNRCRSLADRRPERVLESLGVDSSVDDRAAVRSEGSLTSQYNVDAAPSGWDR